MKNCSIQESLKTITPSFETMVLEFKAVLFKRDELEHRDMSKLKALLTNEEADCDTGNKFHDF